jgi:hypothetical protein
MIKELYIPILHCLEFKPGDKTKFRFTTRELGEKDSELAAQTAIDDALEAEEKGSFGEIHKIRRQETEKKPKVALVLPDNN